MTISYILITFFILSFIKISAKYIISYNIFSISYIFFWYGIFSEISVQYGTETTKCIGVYYCEILRFSHDVRLILVYLAAWKCQVDEEKVWLQ